jgi:hypothetical protein
MYRLQLNQPVFFFFLSSVLYFLVMLSSYTNKIISVKSNV